VRFIHGPAERGFNVQVKSEARALDFFCGGRHLENLAERENSDHFGLLAPFCQVASSTAFASFYHAVQ